MTPMPRTTTNWISGGKPLRKLQNPAAIPRIAMTNRSRTRSMNTVPKVFESEIGMLIFSSQAR